MLAYPCFLKPFEIVGNLVVMSVWIGAIELDPCIKTAQKLKGSDRRQFMAEVVKTLGIGGQTFAERELGGSISLMQ